jgi:hypothetical protein
MASFLPLSVTMTSRFALPLWFIILLLVLPLPSQVELDSLVPKSRSGALGETSPSSSGGDGGLACPGIELPRLCEAMAHRLALQEPDEVIRRAFRAFDPTAKGYISLADLEAAVANVAPGLPAHTVELCFRQLDADGDGRVSFRDFSAMMAARPDGAAPSWLLARPAPAGASAEGITTAAPGWQSRGGF